ncbi:ABC transporter permease [Marinicrinis sediminis]|uniref:ABC transporter permease n=1 Tax=Marinicrinis sediminis TaxID=1652465 RepID=A0ABW5RDY1_9BACL
MSKWMHRMHVGITMLILILVTLPLVPLFLGAFSLRMPWPQLIPDSWSLRAWTYMFSSSSGTGEAIITSIGIAMIVTLINLILAIPAADALSRYQFKGKRWIEAVLYAPIIIPAFVSVMGMHLTFIRLGLTESVFGVVLAHLSPSLPYMIRALMISFGTLGFEWEEQGRMLGAGRFQRFRWIVLPHILPGIIAGSGLSMLVSLSQYLITFLVGGGQVVTIPILLFPFASGGDPTIAAAYTLVFAGLAAGALWGLDMILNAYYRKRSRAKSI